LKLNPINNLAEMKNQAFNMKRLVYRSMTLSTAALKRFYHVRASSNFEAIDVLLDQKLIDEEFANTLLFSLSVACKARLHLSLENEEQND